MAKDDASLKKRSQIQKSNTTMFIWVAGTSVVLGIALVLSIFLFQKLVFNQRVIGAKFETNSILSNNIDTFEDLKNNIRGLSANQLLLSKRAKNEDSAIQVILDALPSSDNGSALGSSLQNVLLKVDGVTVQNISIGNISSNVISEGDSIGNSVDFSFEAITEKSQTAKFVEVLNKLEQSIRAINVNKIKIESGNENLTMTVNASASYEPAKSIELKKEVLEP